ncbi:MarR family winged helix-turn-helix transcriptional regulator [Anaeromyxobacter dehalogenans]|uniref:Transcriptional regulator, MarR family n=1 Tax=Anaeromyxobacter dehalogenans (strain 2CP-C) TaxID=290397 RepID=Q2IN79_ANADE|nr:MarR family transcriptional regulator [Anaeromyxobacter dehalogenans]ABC80258.1 transcriptional regulator, MarR family [Anaeromyxobacter dehalogenans 2CP-C]
MPLPDPSIGLLVLAARQGIREVVGPRASRLRLTVQQYWALYWLLHEPGLAPGALASAMLLDPPAGSRLVSELVKRKLVEARPDREDRRRARLFLSAKGEPLARRVAEDAARYHAESLRGMEPAEVEALRSGLRRLIENLAALGVAPADAGAGRRTGRAARAG